MNIFSSHFRNHYYEIFYELRREDPIHLYLLPNGKRAWIISRYYDCLEILQDPIRFPKGGRMIVGESDFLQELIGIDSNSLSIQSLFLREGFESQRLKYWIRRAFAPKYLTMLIKSLNQHLTKLLEKMKIDQEIDLLEALAKPLSISLLCDLISIPEQYRSRFEVWSTYLVGDGTRTEEGKRAMRNFLLCLQQLIEQKQKKPIDDYLSELIHDGAKELQAHEVIAIIFNLIVTSYETIVSLLTCSVVALHDFPSQKRLLQEHRHLIDSAIEEFLRYCTPIVLTRDRWVSRNLIFRGKTLYRGDYLFLALGSANRDEQVFQNANKLWLSRNPNPHIAFGKEKNFCAGGSFIRLLMKEVLQQLYREFPRLRLGVRKEKLVLRPGTFVRSYSALPVILK